MERTGWMATRRKISEGDGEGVRRRTGERKGRGIGVGVGVAPGGTEVMGVTMTGGRERGRDELSRTMTDNQGSGRMDGAVDGI